MIEILGDLFFRIFGSYTLASIIGVSLIFGFTLSIFRDENKNEKE